MKIVSLFCNIPWTFVGISFALLSFPKKISFSEKPRAIIFAVKSFWWYTWFPKMKRVRAMAIGNVVLLGKNVLDKDLEHELIHVEQFDREPFIHPFLYHYQNFRYGYKSNKYEKEAYQKSGSLYISPENFS